MGPRPAAAALALTAGPAAALTVGPAAARASPAAARAGPPWAVTPDSRRPLATGRGPA